MGVKVKNILDLSPFVSKEQLLARANLLQLSENNFHHHHNQPITRILWSHEKGKHSSFL